jgi:hypothetical protein
LEFRPPRGNFRRSGKSIPGVIRVSDSMGRSIERFRSGCAIAVVLTPRGG